MKSPDQAPAALGTNALNFNTQESPYKQIIKRMTNSTIKFRSMTHSSIPNIPKKRLSVAPIISPVFCKLSMGFCSYGKNTFLIIHKRDRKNKKSKRTEVSLLF